MQMKVHQTDVLCAPSNNKQLDEIEDISRVEEKTLEHIDKSADFNISN